MTTGEGPRDFDRAALAPGLLALLVTFSAGMHAALVPEHLKEMPPLGWSFIAAAVLGAALAVSLVASPGNRGLAKLVALFLAGEVLAWMLFVTVSVPGFDGTPEPVETVALVCKATELLGLAVALPLAWPERLRRRMTADPSLGSASSGTSRHSQPARGRP
jgi:hypothetical protein